MSRIGIVGAGAWGTALALVAAAGGPVTLWARDAALAEATARTRVNARYLPGARLPANIVVTADRAALEGCELLAIVVPAQHLRASLDGLPPATPLLLCAKGIEAATGRLMHEVAAAAAPATPVAALSGPTFAREVAAGLPTAVTIAGPAALAWRFADRFGHASLRPYTTDDVIGAELGGAVKNVLAIGCGVVAGAGLGENARAALIARGFAEMGRLGAALGARAATLAGLAGLGDLVLSCTSGASRNFALGRALGGGMALGNALVAAGGVVEGVATAPALIERAAAAGVEMPIAGAVAALTRGAGVGESIAALLGRPRRAEAD